MNGSAANYNQQARAILFARYCLPLIAAAAMLVLVLPLTAPMPEYLLLGEYVWAEVTQSITLDAFLAHAWGAGLTPHMPSTRHMCCCWRLSSPIWHWISIAAERLLSSRTCSTWIVRAHTALLWISAIGVGVGFMLGCSWRILQYGTTLDALWFTKDFPVKAAIMFPLFPGAPLLRQRARNQLVRPQTPRHCKQVVLPHLSTCRHVGASIHPPQRRHALGRHHSGDLCKRNPHPTAVHRSACERNAGPGHHRGAHHLALHPHLPRLAAQRLAAADTQRRLSSSAPAEHARLTYDPEMNLRRTVNIPAINHLSRDWSPMSHERYRHIPTIAGILLLFALATMQACAPTCISSWPYPCIRWRRSFAESVWRLH